MRLWILLACSLPVWGQLAEKNPFDSEADAGVGRQYYLGYCAICHGPQGEGGRGVNLTTGQYRLGGSDRDLYRLIRNGIPGSEMPGARLMEMEVWKIVAYLKRLAAAGGQEKAGGDPVAGKTVYSTRGACAQCHAVGGRGGALGPELSEIGQRRSVEFLREALVDPSAYIAENYRAYSVITPAGEKTTGILLNEDDYSIHLRDTRENLRSFMKGELKEVKREKESLMPAYGPALAPREIEDLVAYMSSLRRGP